MQMQIKERLILNVGVEKSPSDGMFGVMIAQHEGVAKENKRGKGKERKGDWLPHLGGKRVQYYNHWIVE